MPKKIIRTTPSLFNNWSLCPTKGYYTDIRQIGLSDVKGNGSSPAMEIGTLIHKMLEVYYQLLQWSASDTRETRRLEAIAFGRRAAVDLTTLTSDDVETGIRTFNDYLAWYKDEDIKPVEVEAAFSRVLFENDEYQVLLEGKKDLVAILQGIKWVIDHKTTGRKGVLSPMSNQFFAYAWASDVNTVVINSIGTQKTTEPKERFRRLFVSFTPNQIQEWYENTVNEISLWLQYIERGKYPMNLVSCRNNFGLCQFHAICSGDVADRERIIAVHYKHREPHDPWSDSDG